MVSSILPPFPDDCHAHPLLVIDYGLVKAGDETEVNRLWKAATELGFWYLKNHGLEDKASEIFDMGADTMALPLEEKMKFEQGDSGMSHGYKASGANAVDEYGTLDRVEFINVSKDDALAYPTPVHRTYPSAVNARMEGTIRPFVQGSLAIQETFLTVFNEKLGLPEGALLKKHALLEKSGSEVRVTRTPPHAGPKVDSNQATLGAHTDFGSLSFLHNRLGGLQVLVPGAEGWQYIKPIPGHAICNVGDALFLFSGGILRSNMHRVVAPPGEQAAHERYSAVFFLRPSNDTVLAPMSDESPVIAEAAESLPQAVRDRLKTTQETSAQWFARRIKNQRIKNFTGPETWRASKGTEHQPRAL